MVENVKELLDKREEWWLDDEQGVLYHFPNATDSAELKVNKQGGTAPVYVASMLDTLIAVNGTMDAPARNIHISGLTLAHAAPTFMRAYEVPSAGDWSIHRGGAVSDARGAAPAGSALTPPRDGGAQLGGGEFLVPG